MSSHSDIIFRLCVVDANEADLKQATSKAWKLYALERYCDDPILSRKISRGSPDIAVNPFESEGAGVDAEDSQLWFRVRADTLYYASYYRSDIGDPYDKESIINRLKFIYKNELQPLIEHELGVQIGIVEGHV